MYDDIKNRKQPLNPKQAKIKAAAFCAYQERTQAQVRAKLHTYGLSADEVEQVLTDLIIENFINEERFAKNYSSGKFRLKKWGKVKIRKYLEMLGLSEYCIETGLQEIESSEYIDQIHKLIEKRLQTRKVDNEYELKNKIAHYLVNKGFEADLVWDILKNMSLPDT